MIFDPQRDIKKILDGKANNSYKLAGCCLFCFVFVFCFVCVLCFVFVLFCFVVFLAQGKIYSFFTVSFHVDTNCYQRTVGNNAVKE